MLYTFAVEPAPIMTVHDKRTGAVYDAAFAASARSVGLESALGTRLAVGLFVVLLVAYFGEYVEPLNLSPFDCASQCRPG